MDHLDDLAIKAEIDDISNRINTIIQKLDAIDPEKHIRTEREDGDNEQPMRG